MKRYEPTGRDSCMERRDNGDYCLFDDVEAIVTAAREVLERATDTTTQSICIVPREALGKLRSVL